MLHEVSPQARSKAPAADCRATAQVVRELAERMRGMERRFETEPDEAARPGCVATGWGPIDRAFSPEGASQGGLARGAIHEWLGLVDSQNSPPEPPEPPATRRVTAPSLPGGPGVPGGWTPPLCILTHLAWRALDGGAIVWVGRAVWPYPRVLAVCGGFRGTGGLGPAAKAAAAGGGALLGRSFFIDPGTPGALPGAGAGAEDLRVWAIDLALRSPAVAGVIADGRGLSMAATRRLQLAAEAGRGLGLLARTPAEAATLSAAATRWRVRRQVSSSGQPRWMLELLRCKGRQPVFRASSQGPDASGSPADGAWLGHAAGGMMGFGSEAPKTAGDPGAPRHSSGGTPRRVAGMEAPCWPLEWERATGTVVIPADVADRSGQTQAPFAGGTTIRGTAEAALPRPLQIRTA